MIVNGTLLLGAEPIKDMLTEKHREHGVSYGLAEAGYDIRIKQEIIFRPNHDTMTVNGRKGRFIIASAIEEFDMPNYMVGIVHDKSTWARRGLSVFNTVIEPGFFGGLTLELVYHGEGELYVPAGAGIAQVLFHKIQIEAAYNGKYNGQSTDPTPAIFD